MGPRARTVSGSFEGDTNALFRFFLDKLNLTPEERAAAEAPRETRYVGRTVFVHRSTPRGVACGSTRDGLRMTHTFKGVTCPSCRLPGNHTRRKAARA